MGMIQFQQDLKNGMTLEKALQKHNLTLQEAIEFSPKPITVSKKPSTPRKTNNGKFVDTYVQKRSKYYYVRRRMNGKTFWGGSYTTKKEALLVRDYLNKHGWEHLNIKKACEKYEITRRTK